MTPRVPPVGIHGGEVHMGRQARLAGVLGKFSSTCAARVRVLMVRALLACAEPHRYREVKHTAQGHHGPAGGPPRCGHREGRGARTLRAQSALCHRG